ncbi:MAG: hypothetical protein AVDCRST_MAG27-2974, partial [uncultured Craurococcus sp.]
AGPTPPGRPTGRSAHAAALLPDRLGDPLPSRPAAAGQPRPAGAGAGAAAWLSRRRRILPALWLRALARLRHPPALGPGRDHGFPPPPLRQDLAAARAGAGGAGAAGRPRHGRRPHHPRAGPFRPARVPVATLPGECLGDDVAACLELPVLGTLGGMGRLPRLPARARRPDPAAAPAAARRAAAGLCRHRRPRRAGPECRAELHAPSRPAALRPGIRRRPCRRAADDRGNAAARPALARAAGAAARPRPGVGCADRSRPRRPDPAAAPPHPGAGARTAGPLAPPRRGLLRRLSLLGLHRGRPGAGATRHRPWACRSRRADAGRLPGEPGRRLACLALRGGAGQPLAPPPPLIPRGDAGEGGLGQGL